MTINKTSNQQEETEQIPAHLLADIAGKFGGKVWLATLEEIQRSRKTEKEEINKLLNRESNE